jgi:hypothetical protein
VNQVINYVLRLYGANVMKINFSKARAYDSVLLLLIAMEVLILCASANCQVTKDTTGWFEFVIPGLDFTQTPVDMSFLNSEPAGSSGFVQIKDGHFVDGAGNRLKLLGTNLTFSGAFPDKEIAPQIAKHMRKLGINVVRFHHMDNSPSPGGIWLPDQKGFAHEQLDKLDWIIYQFKQNGIYTNINLHVSRNYPGLSREVSRTFSYGKCLDHFYRPFIEMQKEYARELLTHKNPYTGTTYAQEPAVIVVELNNENTLVQNWGDYLQLPDPFKSALLEQWHDWLKMHYKNTAELRSAWDVVNEPLSNELLVNNDFANGTQDWILATGTSSEGKIETSKDGPKQDENALQIMTTKQGEQSWDLQLHQMNLNLENGAPYTLRFWAKSDEDRSVSVGVRLQVSPWRFVGLQKTVKSTRQWEEFNFVFRAQDSNPGATRLDFDFRNQIGNFWIADVSLRRGGFIGLPEDQSLESGNIPLAQMEATGGMRKDFWNFLFDTEMNYSQEMVSFLKDDLKIKPFVSVTQASYGGMAGIYREAKLSDYTDMHSYWQHPRFPNIPWSSTDWNIVNTSMVSDRNGGTLTDLAIHRVHGKPYTVSEYDHPAPSDYTAEMFPMLASFAAFQDWDGIYQFDYSGRSWDQRSISGFFAMNGHPGKLAFLPIAAVMFRMNGVSPGTDEISLFVPPDDIVAQLDLNGTNAGTAWKNAGAPTALPVMKPVAVQFRDGKIATSKQIPEPSGKWISSTGQIEWDKADPKTAIYTINSPSVRVAVGYLGGKSVTLGNIKIKMSTTETNWASIAVSALDGKDIARSSKILMVVAGRIENTSMVWNETRTSVGNRWGTEPTMAEGIPATISFIGMDGLRIQSLDGTGAPNGEVPCKKSDDGTVFTIGAQYKTLWYLISR